MHVSQPATGLEREYLRALYELAEKKAKTAVSHHEVRTELGRSEEEPGVPQVLSPGYRLTH